MIRFEKEPEIRKKHPKINTKITKSFGIEVVQLTGGR